MIVDKQQTETQRPFFPWEIVMQPMVPHRSRLKHTGGIIVEHRDLLRLLVSTAGFEAAKG